MIVTYIIEEKRTGQYGSSDVRIVRGTHVTIAKGRLEVWNARLENGLHRRPVFSAPAERVVSFKRQNQGSVASDQTNAACTNCGYDASAEQSPTFTIVA
jgi:hypothetical protein